jgi:hypothetical protein
MGLTKMAREVIHSCDSREKGIGWKDDIKTVKVKISIFRMVRHLE